MADINHTKIPNLSIDSLDGTSGVSTPSFTVASTASFVCAGIASVTGALSATGGLTASGTMTLGSAGQSFVGLRKSTVSIRIVGTAHESTTTSATISGMAAGDVCLAIKPASIWSGAYYDLDLEGVPASGALTVVARNSTTTSFNADAMNADVFWLDIA